MTNTFLRDGAFVTDPVFKDSNATYTPEFSERRSGTTKHLSHSLKSVDSQTTTSQSVAASRVYDAFGNVTSSTGTFVGPFGYGGGFGCQEETTGLKLLGHRMYDSSTGRFLTRDPIKDGRNWYVYCDSDPIGFADPTGLVPVLVVIGVIAIAVTVVVWVGLANDLDEIKDEIRPIVARRDTDDPFEMMEANEDLAGPLEDLIDVGVDQAEGIYIDGTIGTAAGEVVGAIGRGIGGRTGDVLKDGSGVSVEAVTEIKGQIKDWLERR